MRRVPEPAIPHDRVWVELNTAIQLADHSTTIRIAGDGSIRVTKKMNDSGKVSEVHRRNVEPRQVEELINAIHKARFFEMPDKVAFPLRAISLQPDGSYRNGLWVSTDGTCYDLTVSLGDERKSVSECNAGWKPLNELYERIYELAVIVLP